MNGIPLANLITALLPIIGGIVVGIVGLLFGQWLTRGQPDVFLIGVEPGITQNINFELIKIDNNTANTFRKFWSVKYALTS